MDEQDWAKELWKTVDEVYPDGVRYRAITDINGKVIFSHSVVSQGSSPESFDRIAACVNACQGIPTEELLITASGHMIACKHCGYNYRVSFPPPDHYFDGVLLKCPSCKKESEWRKAEWPTVKEATSTVEPSNNKENDK